MAIVADAGSGTPSRIRKRKTDNGPINEASKRTAESESNSDQAAESKDDKRHRETVARPREDADLRSGTYWLTRMVLLRYLGFIYCKLV